MLKLDENENLDSLERLSLLNDSVLQIYNKIKESTKLDENLNKFDSKSSESDLNSNNI